ncbi:MAG: EVE domain-containing protein [Rhodothermaeota bacterium MED-G64]|nr:MAG: EVE domain-containing protein [Rhodothermaeota bacterium MED-G64]RPF80108.1 MAG: EVE domain-containing protein [Rhodothermaceae bacterium TMED105]|tara:strand:+ start:10596 stop:11069 length:474 start_codon:yes stop_codon:yes gene_type:complete
MQYWLMKSELDVYNLDHLKADGTEPWDGIRNYEARNMMRDQMKPGDLILYYHSNCKPPHIAGVARVASDPYPDPTQFDSSNHYFDPKSDPNNPRWILVDISYVTTFKETIDRNVLQEDPLLQEMVIFKRNRLSITPVTQQEFERVCEIAGEDSSSFS